MTRTAPMLILVVILLGALSGVGVSLLLTYYLAG